MTNRQFISGRLLNRTHHWKTYHSPEMKWHLLSSLVTRVGYILTLQLTVTEQRICLANFYKILNAAWSISNVWVVRFCWWYVVLLVGLLLNGKHHRKNGVERHRVSLLKDLLVVIFFVMGVTVYPYFTCNHLTLCRRRTVIKMVICSQHVITI